MTRPQVRRTRNCDPSCRPIKRHRALGFAIGFLSVFGWLFPGPAFAQSAEKEALLFCTPKSEDVPKPLAQAFAQKFRVIESGPLRQAAQLIPQAQAALNSLRCSEVVASLRKTADFLLTEVPLAQSQPVATELFGLLLLCADRIGDPTETARAARFLSVQPDSLPPDVARVLLRHQTPAQFGPERPPVWIETDPPGAIVYRNDERLGSSPVSVPGGRPDVDVVQVELPGFRKVLRPLDSGEKLFLSLRPEDRLPKLLDAVALLPVGSESQAQLLAQLADHPAAITQLGRHLFLVGPKTRQGKPVEQETLVARVYDFQRRVFVQDLVDIAIGLPSAQAEAVAGLLSQPAVAVQNATAPALGQTPDKTAAQVAGKAPDKLAQPADKKTDKSADKKTAGSKLPFAKTKWYTWVIAGGVAALIGGLLIAERFSSEKITVTATH